MPSETARRMVGDHRGTLEDYHALIQIEPKNGLALGIRWNAKRMLSDNHGAIEDCTAALCINPQDEITLRVVLPNMLYWRF